MLPEKGAPENLGLSFGGCLWTPTGLTLPLHRGTDVLPTGPCAATCGRLPLRPGPGPTGPQSGSAQGLGPQTCLQPVLLARRSLQAMDTPESHPGVWRGQGSLDPQVSRKRVREERGHL